MGTYLTLSGWSQLYSDLTKDHSFVWRKHWYKYKSVELCIRQQSHMTGRTSKIKDRVFVFTTMFTLYVLAVCTKTYFFVAVYFKMFYLSFKTFSIRFIYIEKPLHKYDQYVSVVVKSFLQNRLRNKIMSEYYRRSWKPIDFIESPTYSF